MITSITDELLSTKRDIDRYRNKTQYDRYHTMEQRTTRLEALNATVDTVSAFIFTCFQAQNFDVTTKTDGSVVTNVDREVELKARKLLLELFPNDGFLGEEYEEIQGTSGYRWVIDPIDGTTSFVRGVPLFGTLLGLEYQGKPIAGVASLPAVGEKISAVTGEGAWLTRLNASNPTRAHVSSTATLDEAMICTTSYDYFKNSDNASMFHALLDSAGSTRGWSDCFAFLLACTGRIDGLVEPILFPWDIIPWIPIIEESGGMYTPIGQGGVMSNPQIHDTLYDVLHANTTN